MTRPLLALLAAALVVGGAACSDADPEDLAALDSTSSTTVSTSVEPELTLPDTSVAEIESVAGLPCVAPVEQATPEGEPEVPMPEGEPPTELVVEDLVEGDGAEATEGATVTAHYVGVACSTGEQFDSSWDRGAPTEFPLDGVIPGWQEGIPGMQVGGRRLLVIPPELAYGEDPPPGSGLAPGETLVFVVDLVEVS
jgi:peptidylprolyl isomerase